MNKIMNTATIKTRLASSVGRRIRFGALGALLGAASLMPTTALGWNYSNVPLFWVQGIKPNVAFMIDDSGSMQAIVANEAYQRGVVAGTLPTTRWYWCKDYDNSSKACKSTGSAIDSGFAVREWLPPTPYKYYGTYYIGLPTYINGETVALCNVTKNPGDSDFYIGYSGNTISLAGSSLPAGFPTKDQIGVVVTLGSSDRSRDSCVRWKMASTGKSSTSGTPENRDYIRYSTGTLYYTPGDSATDKYGQFLLNTLLPSSGKVSINFDDSTVFPNNDSNVDAWDPATDNKVIPNVTRIEAARESAQKIVLDFYDKMNIGLFSFTCGYSCTGQRDYSIPDGSNPTGAKAALIGTTESMLPADLPASAQDGKIGELDAENSTPLANTQKVINDYFQGGSSPIQYRCQKNYAVIMTDGDPTSDSGTLDGRAQDGYDTDAKTGMGDKDGQSWDDPTDNDKWKVQNIVPYTIGFGLENNLLKRTPLVDKVDVPISGISNSIIELKDHGLTTGDYVQVVSNPPTGLTAGNYYYAVVLDSKSFKLAGAGTMTTITKTVDTYTTTTTSTRTCKTVTTNWWGQKSCSKWNSPSDTVVTGPTSSTTGTSTTGGITGDTGSSTTNTRSSVEACISGSSVAIPAGSPTNASNTTSDTGWTPSNSITTQTRVVVVQNTTTTPAPGTQVNGGCAVIGSGSGTMVLSTGPGKSFFSFTPDQLAQDMGKVFNSINNLTSSASAVSTNTKQFNGDPGEKALVYQARFNTEDWSGEVVAYPIQESGGKVFVDTSKDATKEWTTIDTLASAADRKSSKMFTWNPTSATGVGFAWANLDASQQAALGGATVGPNVISWLQGNNVSGMRTHSNKGLLGDILNSDPIFVSSLNQGYTKLPAVSGTGYDTYDAYATASKSRTPMIYVGANDGMLHGLDAATGEEQMTFLPNAVYQDGTEKKLLNLTSSTYDHRYFVDGNVVVGDAHAGGTWSTYLVSGLGRGGKAVFALDVNSTSYTANSTVKWEFTNPGLGYSYGTPIIARLANNKWYAIFPNGLDSSGNKASVFLVNLANAADFIELKAGSTGTPNGMMAVQVQINSQRTVTNIYGGDMQGNIWKWDVYDENGTPNDLSDDTADTSPSLTKLFTAASGQVITGGIRIGVLPGGLGTLVFFGTGKYFETGDAVFNGSSVPQVDSFYAVLDNGTATGLTPSDLVQQTFSMTTINGEEYRTASPNPVNYAGGDMGWYIDLLDGSAKKGERVVSTPVLYGGRVIFVSIKPLEGGTCGGEGSSWLNEFDAMTGNMLAEPPLDTNNDGKVDSNDTVVASAKIDGLGSDPSVVLGQKDDYKIIGSTSTNNSVQVETESKPKGGGGDDDGRKGRMSWRQLQ